MGARRNRSVNGLAEVVALESRRLMCADHLLPGAGVHELDTYPAVTASSTGTDTSAATVAGAGVPLSSVPVLHSNPKATAKLYLDFLGAAAQTWGSYSVPATPAYDQDGDPTTFSSGELASIQEIWARIGEKYSPFNVDVTTQDTGNLTDRVTQKVVFGGNGSWYGGGGGVSYVGAFYNSAPNVSWVFTSSLANGDPHYTAEAGAHEAGHAFGLNHQSTYSGTTKTAEYNQGSGATAPVMGNSYYATRGVWWDGTSSVSSTTIQDDLSVIAGSSNGFGYRVDDYGNSISAATALTLSGSSVGASGVISSTADADYFSVASGAGTLSLSASPVLGGMLDAKLSVYDSGGHLLGSSDSGLGESLSLSVSGGTYYVAVSSHGSYGDVGQYTLSGTVVPPTGTQPPAAPGGLTAAAASTSQINLSWGDVAGETSFRVERSADGGATWATAGTTGAGVTSFADTGLAAATTYSYRVVASNAGGDSGYSAVAAATTLQQQGGLTVAAPSGLTAVGVSATTVNLAWADNASNEGGFTVQRSADGGTTWAGVATLGANVTAWGDTAAQAGTSYAYRVQAFGGTVTSAWSNVASVTTVTAAPGRPTASVVSSSQINLKWSAVSGATSYGVERSVDGGKTWAVAGTTGAGVVTFADTGLAAQTTYVYRVRAGDAGGYSAYGATASATTTAPLPAAPSGLTAAVVTSNLVNLSWVDNSTNETGFQVERYVKGKWSRVASLGAGVTAYADKSTSASTTYSYRVCAVNAAGTSAYSDVAAATTPATAGGTSPKKTAGAKSVLAASVFSTQAVLGADDWLKDGGLA